MSDNNSNTAAVTGPATIATSKAQRSRSGLAVFFSLLVWLVALAALAASGYVYYVFTGVQLAQQQVVQQTQGQQTALQKSQQVSVAQQQLIVSLQEQLRGVESQQLHLYEANAGLKRRLQELSHTDRSDWQLAEIEYLLRLAHQRVISNNNTRLGLELLLSADELLRELDNADLFVIREQIAADSLALRNVVDVDVDGRYLSLSALAKQVEALQFNKTEFKQAPAAQVATPKGLAKLWQQLASLYRITPREGLLQPLYSQQQQQAVTQQLLLLLGHAKQALLTASSALYVASLVEARDVARRYAVDNEQRFLFITQLETFSALEVAPKLPDISASHTQMRNYIDTKRQRGLVPVVLPDNTEASQ